MRAIIVVMDSVGIGSAPDASAYGDAGADTVGHIAEACASGAADDGVREGPLNVPNLIELGLAEACRLATGRVPPVLHAHRREDARSRKGRCGCAAEISKGKDTPSGHWELAGVPVTFDWGYFPRTVPCFPDEIVAGLCRRAGLPGILANCHASGTEIISRYGDEHMRCGKPICYTSADSVFQIAAHEQQFGLERLYQVCEIARELLEPLNIGRVIARPFTGAASSYVRTHNRRDYAVPPPDKTILDLAAEEGRDVVTIGKIGDIFAHRGTGRVLKGDGNDRLFDRMLEGFDSLGDGGLLFANFIDFDSIYGHRRDVPGYAAALEAFDKRLAELLRRLKSADLLVVTADHGCDPTWKGTDHTREQVPVLVLGGDSSRAIGARSSFADVGASVAAHLGLPGILKGNAF
jgi:phosphopentomutase